MCINNVYRLNLVFLLKFSKAATHSKRRQWQWARPQVEGPGIPKIVGASIITNIVVPHSFTICIYILYTHV